MSHPHSQAGFWAGIPASTKLTFVGEKKNPPCLEGKKGGGCLWDFRKLTSAIWLFFKCLVLVLNSFLNWIFLC